MILYTECEWHTEVYNDVIIWHENEIELDIRITACTPHQSSIQSGLLQSFIWRDIVTLSNNLSATDRHHIDVDN